MSLSLYITSDPKDLILDEFWWNVSIESKDNNLPRLTDNPYDYDRLINQQFKYAVLWLYNDRAVYGWLAMQYDFLPKNVIRFFTRMYKLKGFNLSMKFIRYEHKRYRKNLKPLLDLENIDTIFFTRHTNEQLDDKDKWKNPRSVKLIMGDDINISYKENVMFRGWEQTIYYYSAWTGKKPNNEFLSSI